MCGLGSIRSQFRTCQVDERTKEKKGCFLGDIDTGGPWASLDGSRLTVMSKVPLEGR